MNNEEKNRKIKQIIVKKISNFLLPDKSLPSEILITVTYGQAFARLRIDEDEIKAATEDK